MENNENNDAFDLTMEEFLRIANLDYVQERSNWLVIVVQNGNHKPEYIFNPKKNFEAKMVYYTQAYDEHLILKSNPDIRIVQYDFVANIQEFLTFEELV